MLSQLGQNIENTRKMSPLGVPPIHPKFQKICSLLVTTFNSIKNQLVQLQSAGRCFPSSTQIRPKRAPNSKPTCIMFWLPFFIDLGSLLGWFSVGFGLQVGSQVDKKMGLVASFWQVGQNSKNLKKPGVFQGFWAPRPSNFEAKLAKNRPQSDQKSSKNLINILTQILIDFWSNLDRFWEDFGIQVGAKLAQNAYKIRPQNQSKKWLLLGRLPSRFWMDFGSILGPRGGSPEMLFGCPEGSWGHLGAKMVPKMVPRGT